MLRRTSSLACWLMLASLAVAGDWPQFRGPAGTNVAVDESGLPQSWDGESGKNIAWKVALPDRGLSTPIVIGDRVVVTACSGPRQARLHVICVDANSGKRRWERQLWAIGRTMTHPKTNTAAPSPASDGKRIFASFSTNDVACFDLEGNLLWFRGLTHDYPNASNSLGMASSPVVVGNTLVLQVENDSESFALGLDVETGENRWKVDRPTVANWTSPAVMKYGDKQVVCLQSSTGVVAYEAHTGEEVWRYNQGCGTIPSPVVHKDVIYVPLRGDERGIAALFPRENLSKPQVLWKEARLAPSTPSPMVYKDRIYTIGSSGVLTCGELEFGERKYQLRLKGSFSGTPVIADDHMYAFNEDGDGQVVDLRGEEAKIVSTSKLGESILCSPAVAGGAIYVRSDKHLWKIADAGQ